MKAELVSLPRGEVAPPPGLPRVIAAAGPKARERFLEFLTVRIRNPNTRRAYARASLDFFRWCDGIPVDLHHIEPIVVAAYIERHPSAKPTVKQHLAAIRTLFDWLVLGQIIPANPAASVRAPSHIVRQGRTPVLSPEETRRLLDGIERTTVIGLRDRALIGLMVYTFARVSAATSMKTGDVFRKNGQTWVRLEEKGGKQLELPVHHELDAFLKAYLDAAWIRGEKKAPLFRTAAGKTRSLTSRPMSRADVYRMIVRRARAAGIETQVGCHTFRATGITAYLRNGGRLEVAQAMAGHETPTTTALYDRRTREVTLQEVERVTL